MHPRYGNLSTPKRQFVALNTFDLAIDQQASTAAPRFGMAERDFITLAVAIVAIVLFVWLGGKAMTQLVHSLTGMGIAPDRLLVSTLLLNIALLIFSWRRYSQLHAEIDERRQAVAEARHLADTDPLTGCLNRRSLAAMADRLIADATDRGDAAALVMIDLDNFKQINDFNSHSTGDQILIETARRIAEKLPTHALLARLGGDEFACVTTYDGKRPESVEKLALAIIASIAEPIEANGLSISITASLGLASSKLLRPDDTRPAAPLALLHMADIALFHAKKQGRNRYFWFDAQMEIEQRFRGELEAGIRFGIPLGEFVPYFEQQIDLQTGELTGFEMLARWNSPSLGLIGPDVFIPIAEEIGVIGELSECVIAQALVEAREWDAGLTLSVNISPIQLRDPWFAQKLLKILVETNFPPSRLELEITESCLHENIGVVRTLIISLKNQGIRISLDDFGTGYSSLAQLRSLPFDRIKIDRSFISNLPESADSAKIVEAITTLGEGLGLPITAEGVENAEVLERLRGMGKYKGQGYHYGRPETAAATRAKLTKMNLLAGSKSAVPAKAKPQRAKTSTAAARIARAG